MADLAPTMRERPSVEWLVHEIFHASPALHLNQPVTIGWEGGDTLRVRNDWSGLPPAQAALMEVQSLIAGSLFTEGVDTTSDDDLISRLNPDDVAKMKRWAAQHCAPIVLRFLRHPDHLDAMLDVLENGDAVHFPA